MQTIIPRQPRLTRLVAPACAVCVAVATGAARAGPDQDVPLVIPKVVSSTKRAITVDDVVTLRTIDTLSVSPDGSRYAIFVRQADPVTNEYRTAWFAGSTQGGGLKRLGDGGWVRPKVMPTGHMPGTVEGSESRWSPDGSWIVFMLERDGEVQLWRSRIGGGVFEQITHNAADVRDFAWSDDGRALYFTAGTPRGELRTREQSRAQQGYRYDKDLWLFTDFMAPRMVQPPETALAVWVVHPGARKERPASEPERAAFLRAVEQRSAAGSRADSASVTAIADLRDDDLRHCSSVTGNRLVCVRETAVHPPHVAAIDLGSGRVEMIADVNPEFRNIRLGNVERFEWDTPKFRWNEPGGALAGLYAERTYGYIIYPPDFDPARKYPVFIDPYVAKGFRPLGAEHALHVYAANGIVVLRTAFPLPTDRSSGGGAADMKQLYSDKLGFPHLTMLMDSTLLALDAVVARGFIDEQRVGIGGVSHGTFVPLYMLQKHDRIAAISISSPTWGPFQHYWNTKGAREALAAFGFEDWTPKTEDEGQEFWSKIDLADHVDAVEAPILMNLAAQETYALVRLIRHLADADKPYDAYVFRDETHIKWQPAHLRSIMDRNLDWFRFWLQDYEDPAAAKSEQYQRWHQLRELQCKNRRSLRNYCPGTMEKPGS